MPSESKISLTELPSGTVTFLFTDIQGSTELLKQLGEAYAILLADNRRMPDLLHLDECPETQ